jgi:hypothetical protein
MFTKFTTELSKVYDFNIEFKNNSLFMKILGFIMFFNRGFMTNYITTIGNTIYFPSQEMLKDDELSNCAVLAHELRHIQQNKKYGLLYSLGYLFPQILVIFSLLAFFNLWFLLFLVCALPIPAIFRMIFEREGYKTTMFVLYMYLVQKNIDSAWVNSAINNYIDNADQQFTSSAYYYMWPFGAKNYLSSEFGRIKTGDILTDNDNFYINVRNAFLNSL